MLPDRVSNPGPLTYESGALPIALRGPAALTFTRRNKHLLMHLKGCTEQQTIGHIYRLTDRWADGHADIRQSGRHQHSDIYVFKYMPMESRIKG